MVIIIGIDFVTSPEGKFSVTKFEFEDIFVTSLKGDCHEAEDAPNMELLVTYGLTLEGDLS
jgi:hypothetical protein